MIQKSNILAAVLAAVLFFSYNYISTSTLLKLYSQEYNAVIVIHGCIHLIYFAISIAASFVLGIRGNDFIITGLPLWAYSSMNILEWLLNFTPEYPFALIGLMFATAQTVFAFLAYVFVGCVLMSNKVENKSKQDEEKQQMLALNIAEKV